MNNPTDIKISKSLDVRATYRYKIYSKFHVQNSIAQLVDTGFNPCMIYFGENIKIDVIPQESGVQSRLAALHFDGTH